MMTKSLKAQKKQNKRQRKRLKSKVVQLLKVRAIQKRQIVQNLRQVSQQQQVTQNLRHPNRLIHSQVQIQYQNHLHLRQQLQLRLTPRQVVRLMHQTNLIKHIWH